MQRQKTQTHKGVVIFLCVFCALLIGAGIYFFISSVGGSREISALFQVEGLDPAAQTGALPGSPRNEKAPGDGLFSYRINATPVFEGDGTGGDILVQNPAFNEFLMVLEIGQPDDGTLLYQSQYIAPNQYIEKIDLQKQLDPGEYEVVAYINIIDPKTLSYIDTLECPLVLTVK